MALTQEQEEIIQEIIEAYQNGATISDLPDAQGTNPANQICEVLESGESKKMSVASMTSHTVHITEQTLTDSQKAQARTNINAAAHVTVVSQLPSVAVKPNEIVKLGQVSDCTITLAAGETGKAAVYDIIFSTGTTAPTITWPTGLSWMGGNAPTIAASKTYEVSISEGLAVIAEY